MAVRGRKPSFKEIHRQAIAEARVSAKAAEEKKRYEERKELAADLLEIIDEEIYDLKRELTWGGHDKRKMRAIVMRQMVKTAVAGMNEDHFREAETDDEPEEY